jgi:hypothetical protein
MGFARSRGKQESDQSPKAKSACIASDPARLRLVLIRLQNDHADQMSQKIQIVLLGLKMQLFRGLADLRRCSLPVLLHAFLARFCSLFLKGEQGLWFLR